MKLLQNDKFNAMIIAFAFAFNILLFAPVEMYYTNQANLWFAVTNILVIAIPLTILIAGILFILILRSNQKEKMIFSRIVVTFMTGLYLQGNFLNFGYGLLDGSDVDWWPMIEKGLINTMIWLFLIIFPFEIKKLKKFKNYKTYSSGISAFICAIEMITLITVVLTNTDTKYTNKVLANKNIMNLSKQDNIIVFMSDTFEGTYMDQVLENHPEFKERLEDFTYFDNATGASFYTYSSMPTLLTGVPCKVGNTLQQNLKECFNTTELYQVLKDNNYSTEIYVEKAIIPYTDDIDNYVQKKDVVKFSADVQINLNLYKAVLYRYLPHFLKASFVVSGDNFSRIKTQNSQELGYREKSYTLDDVAFHNSLVQDGISSNEEKNTFKFYQFDGMHRPYETTEDLQYDSSKEYTSQPQEIRRYYEGVASIKLLCDYVDELKKAGTYDNTTIIFLADHGYDNRFWVNLLVKKAHDNHEFQISSAPVSTATDLIPTILNIATNSKDYGKDFFDYQIGEQRTRQVNDYTYQSNFFGKNDYLILSKMVFESDQEARNKESFHVIDEEYRYDENKLVEKYETGKLLYIRNLVDSESVRVKGFALERVNTSAPSGANISRNTSITINRQEVATDVVAKFDIERVYGSSQLIQFKINGEEIYSETISEPKTISVIIPKEEWNLKDTFTLEIEFPNAVLGEQEFTMMAAIKLKSIQFIEQ